MGNKNSGRRKEGFYKSCPKCGESFYTKKSHFKRRIYCSTTCSLVGKKGEEGRRWKGGRVIDKGGYILIFKPDHPNATVDGYVREHRLVMEQTLGRLLDKREVVHHKDDNPANNDPDNLELFANNAEHLRDTLW